MNRRQRQVAFALNMGENAAIVAVIILVLAVLTGCTGDVQADEANKRSVEARQFLVHPLPYSAVVCQSGAAERPKCRFYREEVSQ